MPIKTTVVGSYPKPPAEGETFKVRKTIHALDKGSASVEDLHAAQDELAREVIAEQEAAGIDVVTDGHVRWDDILTPFARNIAGFEIGGLLRWFDNNVYYRRPICIGDLEWRGPSAVESFRFAASVATGEVKQVIPGPVTFARLSVDEHYGDHETFVLAIARVVAQEAFELEAAGARFIQIDEPAILGAPEDLSLALKALDVVTEELGQAELTLGTYFGDAKRLGTEFFELPVHRFGFDLVSGPENRELLRSLPPDKSVQVGVVDARNTRLEDTSELERTIQDVVGELGAERVVLSPSAGLEFLPREKARAKLERLAQAAQKVGE